MMFRYLTILAAVCLIFASLASADEKEITTWDRYITANMDDNPGTIPLTTIATWKHLGGAEVAINEAINSTHAKWIGIDNIPITSNVKYAIIRLKGTGLNNLHIMGVDSVYGVIGGVKSPGRLSHIVVQTDTVFTFKIILDPQPEWEVVKLSAVGGNATITRFFVDTHCTVPSLTEWGVAVLVLLLIVTGYIMYRRQRRAVA